MATAKIILRVDKPLASGECMIVLRIIKDRKKRDMALKFNSKPELWDSKLQQPKSKHPHYHELKNYIAIKEKEVQQAFLDLQSQNRPFTVDDIVNKLSLSIKVKNTTVFKYFDEHIQKLIEAGKVGYANVFRESQRQLKKFRNDKDLTFYDLNPVLIKKFDEFILKRGVKLNSAFVYVRTLKTLVNKAISDGLVDERHNPFKGISFAKYRKDKPQKRALTKDQIEAIKKFNPEQDKKLQFAKDLFLFSYYLRGMNFTDLAYLKWKDIKSEQVNYIRKKTSEPFKIKMIAPALAILEQFKKYYEGETSYVFPILSEKHETPVQKDNRIDKIMKIVNSSLKEISMKLEFPEKFTFYAARHSFATISRNSGVPVGMISEALGHDSEKTTQMYLDSFDSDKMNSVFENVL